MAPYSFLASGIPYALAAYTAWGLFPAYWKLLKHVPSSEILAHRIVWASVFFLVLGFIRDRAGAAAKLRLAVKKWRALGLASLLIGANWWVYIYAVNHGFVLESSLGYFINPLVNVALGSLFLGERLARIQKVAVGIAALGVLQLAAQGDHVPYIALFLAGSFGTYGLLRKKLGLDPLSASAVESLFLTVPALAYLGAAPGAGDRTFLDFWMLMLGGVVTGLPLLWFMEAAKRLPLSTLGFFQYLAPSLQFSLAVFAFGEAFTAVHAKGFAMIWAALALYSVELARGAARSRGLKRAAAASSSAAAGKPA